MEISKTEYKLLKKIRQKGQFAIKNDISDTLICKGLVYSDEMGFDENCSTIYSDELKLTNDGVIAYENYRDKILSIRRANIQSWIAIIISIGSLAVSIISLL